MTVQEALFERTEQESILAKYTTKVSAFLKATFKRKEQSSEKTAQERIHEALQTIHQLIQENKLEEAKMLYKDIVSYYNSLADEGLKQKLYNSVFDVYSVLATK